MTFAVDAFHFSRPLFRVSDTRHIGDQLMRCSASVAANYRAACLARSKKEWLAKIGVVREESDESVFWLEFIARAGIGAAGTTEGKQLTAEAKALAKIFNASYLTGKQRPLRHSASDQATMPKNPMTKGPDDPTARRPNDPTARRPNDPMTR